MNKYFDVKDKVYDIVQKYPETLDVFSANGFEQLQNEAMRKTIGKTIDLVMACSMKKMNLELFESKLVDIIKQTRESEDVFLNQTERNEEAETTVLGVLPCPVRIPLMESFKEWMEANKDISLDYELKAANTGVEWIRDSIKNATEENITDLFMSAGFDLFFDEELMGKFKKRDIFEDMSGFERLNKDFDNEQISLKDPAGQYSVISVVPAVFLVNTDELNGRRMPLSWEELLSPEFEKSISLPLNDFDLFNALLLSIYKEFGEDGIRRLGRAHMRSMTPAEMVKSNRKSESGIPTVTVMPYLFAKMVREESPLKAVWPKEGAVISPIFLLAKKSSRERIQPLVDFFMSKEVGQMLATNGKFPSTHPEVVNNLNEDQKFMWLGWDYINNHSDLGALIKKLMDIFYEESGGK
ncbi:MAG: ABC transporter substrate-binding protein [Gudongella sp.]|nr:ABC transporter substrate-binding protein [Gudongella sp.]